MKHHPNAGLDNRVLILGIDLPAIVVLGYVQGVTTGSIRQFPERNSTWVRSARAGVERHSSGLQDKFYIK
ncbi:hypothetical protein [Paraburkholderia nodosa]|uniref:hypothetical protein n=1 Tax=Paraburkholderia nodosa TaxID=392320 RepID=UPI0004B459E2|nr:hypothetical protein [Paraburkholderia nodosa]